MSQPNRTGMSRRVVAGIALRGIRCAAGISRYEKSASPVAEMYMYTYAIHPTTLRREKYMTLYNYWEAPMYGYSQKPHQPALMHAEYLIEWPRE